MGLEDSPPPYKLTLEQLAKATGMTKTNLSRLETGSENVTVKTLERYAEGLGAKLHLDLSAISDQLNA